MKTAACFVHADGSTVETEVEWWPMRPEDDAEREKIANASLHQRAAMMAEIQQLHEALIDIEELCDGYVDIDRNGQPNLAMKIMTIINLTLKDDR